MWKMCEMVWIILDASRTPTVMVWYPILVSLTKSGFIIRGWFDIWKVFNKWVTTAHLSRSSGLSPLTNTSADMEDPSLQTWWWEFQVFCYVRALWEFKSSPSGVPQCRDGWFKYCQIESWDYPYMVRLRPGLCYSLCVFQNPIIILHLILPKRPQRQFIINMSYCFFYISLYFCVSVIDLIWLIDLIKSLFFSLFFSVYLSI